SLWSIRTIGLIHLYTLRGSRNSSFVQVFVHFAGEPQLILLYKFLCILRGSRSSSFCTSFCAFCGGAAAHPFVQVFVHFAGASAPAKCTKTCITTCGRRRRPHVYGAIAPTDTEVPFYYEPLFSRVVCSALLTKTLLGPMLGQHALSPNVYTSSN